MRVGIEKRRKRPTVNSEIQRFCFSDIFNGLKSHQIVVLRELYNEHQGEIPGRRVVGDTAKAIGLSQARVRRWFHDERNSRSKEADSFNTMSSEGGGGEAIVSGCWKNSPSEEVSVEKLHVTISNTEVHLQTMTAFIQQNSRILGMIEENLFLLL